MAKRRALKGVGRVRKMLRRLPDDVAIEINALLANAGQQGLVYARSQTPSRTGALRNALAVKLFPKSMRMRLGLIGKRQQRNFFYGHILDKGRKAKSVRVSRRTPSGAIINYVMRVSPISPARYDIVYGRAEQFIKNLVNKPLADIYRKALRRAAGVSDD
jgi:hypothetical protein